MYNILNDNDRKKTFISYSEMILSRGCLRQNAFFYLGLILTFSKGEGLMVHFVLNTAEVIPINLLFLSDK